MRESTCKHVTALVTSQYIDSLDHISHLMIYLLDISYAMLSIQLTLPASLDPHHDDSLMIIDQQLV